MKKILFAGFPCTRFSIAQKKDRESLPYTGEGWELFYNALLAKEKFNPDFFLFENNYSISQQIKDEVSKLLGTDYIMINAALVSAQTRKRVYWTNWDNTQPQDRGILLKDILEFSKSVVEKEKAYCLCTDHMGTTRDYFKKHQSQVVFEPVRIGTIENNSKNKGHDSQQYRVYSCYGKSVCLCGGGGGIGAKTGLYFTPLPQELERLVCDKGKIYEIKDGFINIKVGKFPCNMPDGYYLIRKLTVREAARLQTMPDYYFDIDNISDTQKYRGIGNGWCAEVIIHLLKEGLKDVSRDEELQVLSMYDGIGTAMYCLKQLGFTNIKYKAYEIDKYAIHIAQYNHPEIIQCGDAFQLRNDNWSY